MANNSKLILLFLSTILFNIIFIFVFVPTFGSSGKMALIPGSPLIEMLLLLGAPIFLVPICSVFFRKIMMKFYPKLGKKLKGRDFQLSYYIYKREKANRELFSRILFAAMVALTLGLVIAQGLLSVGVYVFADSLVGSIATMTYLLLPLTAILIPPLGWLDDLGLVLYKQMEPHTNCPEVIGVGQFLALIYKGFVGITTPVIFIGIIINEIRVVGNVVEVLLLVIFPLFLTGYFIPVELWMQRKKKRDLEHVANFIRDFREQGIQELNLEINIQ